MPSNESAKARLAAEEGWLNLGHDLGLSAQVFRLGGIYGPGRRLKCLVFAFKYDSYHFVSLLLEQFTLLFLT